MEHFRSASPYGVNYLAGRTPFPAPVQSLVKFPALLRRPRSWGRLLAPATTPVLPRPEGAFFCARPARQRPVLHAWTSDQSIPAPDRVPFGGYEKVQVRALAAQRVVPWPISRTTWRTALSPAGTTPPGWTPGPDSAARRLCGPECRVSEPPYGIHH
jgi:hypothetical protein